MALIKTDYTSNIGKDLVEFFNFIITNTFNVPIVLKLLIIGSTIMICFILYNIINSYLLQKNWNSKLIGIFLWNIIPLISLVFLWLTLPVVGGVGEVGHVVNINMQLIVIFYFVYMIRDHSQIYFNIILSLMYAAYYIYKSPNTPIQSLIMYGVSLVAIGISVYVINKNSKVFIERVKTYILTEIVFAICWWSLHWGYYRLDIFDYFALITQFVILMLVVHLINIFVRNQWNNYTKLVSDANTDFLTKIGNREAFDHTFSEVFNQVVNEENLQAFTFVMFDIDDFKKFNDTYGHVTGDKVLIAVAQGVRSALDLNATGGQVFRLGGEEFGIVFRNVHEYDALEMMIEVCKKVDRIEIPFKDKKLKISISVGGGELSPVDTSEQGFYSRVDTYLYRSKMNGKRQLTFDQKVVKY